MLPSTTLTFDDIVVILRACVWRLLVTVAIVSAATAAIAMWLPNQMTEARRRYGILPGVESGTVDASAGNWPTARRFRMWLDASITTAGRPDWIFIKVHTHGAPEPNADALLGSAMGEFHGAIQQEVRERGLHLHYAATREMVNVVRTASGDPGRYRDYWLPPPRRQRIARDRRHAGSQEIVTRS